MKMILADGTKLYPILVTGEHRFLQGVNRDVFTFVFGDVDISEIDTLFTEANCETLKLYEEVEEQVEVDGVVTTRVVEVEYIHTGYTIRVDIRKTREVVEESTVSTEEVTEQRVEVTMAQRTYSETKLATMSQEITDTQVALCELYEGGLV